MNLNKLRKEMGDRVRVDPVGTTMERISTMITGDARVVKVKGLLDYEVDTGRFNDESELAAYLKSKMPTMNVIPGG